MASTRDADAADYYAGGGLPPPPIPAPAEDADAAEDGCPAEEADDASEEHAEMANATGTDAGGRPAEEAEEADDPSEEHAEMANATGTDAVGNEANEDEEEEYIGWWSEDEEEEEEDGQETSGELPVGAGWLSHLADHGSDQADADGKHNDELGQRTNSDYRRRPIRQSVPAALARVGGPVSPSWQTDSATTTN
jgi:hypothetical protein